MTECDQKSLNFERVQRRHLEAEFSGGDITSNAGLVPLERLDRLERRLGLTDALAQALDDPCRQASCQSTLSTLLRQRIYALALGYEDVNDHGALRFDTALQAACGQLTALGSESAVGRVERRCGRMAAWAFHRVLVEQFIASLIARPMN